MQSGRRKGRAWRTRRRNKRRSTFRPKQSFTTESVALLQSLKSQGYVNKHHLEIYDFGNCLGRGVVNTRRSIKANDTLIELPLSCMVFPSAILQAEPELYQGLEENQIMPFWVYLQRLRLDQGKPCHQEMYIRHLPQHYNLSFLTPKQFQSNLIPASFRNQIKCNYQKYESIKSAIIKQIKTIHSVNIKFVDELFRWAYSVVNTRALDPNCGEEVGINVDDEFALAPFFDLISHSANPNASISISKEEGVFRIVADETIKKWQQVTVSYNQESSNRELYLEYGFICNTTIPPLLVKANVFQVIPNQHDLLYFDFKRIQRIIVASLVDLEYTNDAKVLKARKGNIKRNLEKMAASGIYQKETIQSDQMNTDFVIFWPEKLLESCLNIDRDPDGKTRCTIFDMAGKPLDEELLNGMYMSNAMEILFTVLALEKYQLLDVILEVGSLPEKRQHSGPGVAMTYDERLTYYQLQLLCIKGVLREDHGQIFTDDDDSESILQSFSDKAYPDLSLGALFKNEIALLLYTKTLLEEKVQQLETNRFCMLLDVEDAEFWPNH